MQRKTFIKIGIIGIISIVLLIWGINFLKGKSFFKDSNVFYVVYHQIDGLTLSSQVVMNGYAIGQVSDIYFDSEKSNSLLVTLEVSSDFFIPENSVAEIYSMDLMGTKAIRILRNDSTQIAHVNGDTLSGTTEGDFKDQVNMQILPLKRKAEDLISSFDSVLVVIRTVFDENTRMNLSRSFSSISLTLANLERTTFTLDTLVSSEKSKLVAIFSNIESITQNLKNNNENLSHAIKNFSNISDSLAKADLAYTIAKTNSALAHVNDIVNKINNGEGSLALLLNNDTLYRNLDNASYHMNRLLRDIHENPKRYVRFSLIDLGRTKYVVAPDDDIRKKEKKTKKQGTEKKAESNEKK